MKEFEANATIGVQAINDAPKTKCTITITEEEDAISITTHFEPELNLHPLKAIPRAAIVAAKMIAAARELLGKVE